MPDVSHHRCSLLSCLILGCFVICAARVFAQDADNDGLPDDTEELLGTDPSFAEPLETVGTFPARPDCPPALDIVRLEMGNVAQDRWLWAVHFAAPYTFENTDLILYLDCDNDAHTGRKDMGCEVMLSHRLGAPGITAFAPDGTLAQGRAPRIALVNGVLYMCHDDDIKQEAGRSVFRVTVLSETVEPHVGVDSTGWVQASGPPTSDRKKVQRLEDITHDENFEKTEGLDLIWQLQADPANIIFQSPNAELSGLSYYDAEYRWWAVHGPGGSITVTVPRAGRFHPAIVVYDAHGADAYELRVDGKRVGRFVAAEDDNRQRVHFLSQPLDFKGGEKLTFIVAGDGRHITEDVMLLAQRPPVRGRKFELSHVEAGYVRRDAEGQVRLTWITTWPAACTIEYWTEPEKVQRLTEPQPVANHRVLLDGLQEGATYHYRILAPRPDGQVVTSQEASFVCEAPPAVRGTARRESVPLKVENPYDFALSRFPVSSGVPFAQGELGDPTHVRLLDARGAVVPVQAKVTGWWRDGSVKWLLLSFLADVEREATAGYTLEYGTEVTCAFFATALQHSWLNDVLTIDTGVVRARFEPKLSGLPTAMWFDADGNRMFGEEELVGSGPLAAELVGPDGEAFTSLGPAHSLEIEESGPIRCVVKVTGHHVSAAGQRFFSYTSRFVFYAGSPLIRLYYTWGNDQEQEFATFERVSLNLPVASAAEGRWTVGLGGGQEASGHGEMTLRQMRDSAFELRPAAAPELKTQRADGWVDLSTGRWGVTAAVRDFWQLYPKALRVTPQGLSLDLCPDFPEGTYDGCSKLEEIHYYFYLMGGTYKIRRGMQKQHEVLLYFHPASMGDRERQVAHAFQEPLIAACTPERYCETSVFGEILPATTGRTSDYEALCERVYRGYVGNRETARDYGMLNFGDTWGERRVNWANGEYDHHHAFLLQFARTAERRWYFLGERAARHAIDVDTCHYGPQAGGEWIHAMGHTGRYFDAPYEGDGIPWGGFTPSHTWTEGFYDWYVLSGDPTAAENAALVADYYDGAYLNNYDWSNCRDNGWHLIFTLATYRATNDPYYLNAARIIVERTLERQSPGGGWHRQMVPGHCYDMPRHRGEANFMLGVLANALELYYAEVPDPRIPAAIMGGAKQAVNELWVPEVDGFRYTSCPNMTGYTANNDMTAEILFFAHRLGGDSQFADIAMRAMRAAFKGGIGHIAHLRWTPHIIYNMDLLSRGKPMVTIEGARSLHPGETALWLRAVATDTDDDIASITWTLDDGTTVEGERLEWRPTSGGRRTVTVTVTDRAGNQSTAAASTLAPPAELMTADPRKLILVEAEDFVAQGLDEVKVFERIGSRGKMITYWDATKGHWLEWDLPIAEEGEYVIYLRYASGGRGPHRALTIDGASPGPPFDDMALPPTGGFSTAEDNWAFYATGGGTPVHLTAGTHRLRLTNLGDGVGLDYIVLLRK